MFTSLPPSSTFSLEAAQLHIQLGGAALVGGVLLNAPFQYDWAAARSAVMLVTAAWPTYLLLVGIFAAAALASCRKFPRTGTFLLAIGIFLALTPLVGLLVGLPLGLGLTGPLFALGTLTVLSGTSAWTAGHIVHFINFRSG